MRVLYCDCFSGISGDMTLGALLDLGIDPQRFRQELQKLNLPGYEIRIAPKMQNGIAGTDVQVILTEGPVHSTLRHDHVPAGHDQAHVAEEEHEHHHHDHEHDHDHHHDRQHEHGHAQSERNLGDIERIIDQSDLSQAVRDFSKKVFREIARAEAKVHHKEIHEVHFHEVGAVDSIVDIVGSAICLDWLGVEQVYASPLHDGHGMIECRHGMIPVPVPAVLEMLAGSGIPMIAEDVNTELVTPTGMGLIKSLAVAFGGMPPLVVEKTGYGMGKRETGRLNALRVVLGSLYEGEDAGRGTPSTSLKSSPTDLKTAPEIIVLETNIDDVSPEVLGFTAGKLMERGALDVFYTPVYMKKNRPAFMLTVLTDHEKEKKLVDIILQETSTIGIRRSTADRYCMERETVRVQTEIGAVRVKIGYTDVIRKGAPEYEDCKQIAEQTGLPLRTVYEKAMEAARKQHALK